MATPHVAGVAALWAMAFSARSPGPRDALFCGLAKLRRGAGIDMSKRELSNQALQPAGKPQRRFSLGMLLLLPLLLPAALLAASVVAFVARTLLTVAFEVSAGLIGGMGWLVWPIACLLLVSMLKRSRRQNKPPDVVPAPVPAPPPRAAAVQPASALTELVVHTRGWLSEQSGSLPAQLQERIHSMQSQLTALAPQLEAGKQDALVSAELEQVLREELPQLIHAYRRVPHALQQRRLHGGSSPEQQLSAGLATLDSQLVALHERLAAPDLQALAVHQRYLDLKYNPPGSA
jgi:hypothetical protein